MTAKKSFSARPPRTVRQWPPRCAGLMFPGKIPKVGRIRPEADDDLLRGGTTHSDGFSAF